MKAEQRLEEVSQRKEKAIEQVRGLGDDYHPFDRQTGMPVTAQEVGVRLGGHLGRLDEVVQQAGLGQRATEAVCRCRSGVGVLVGCVGWFLIGIGFAAGWSACVGAVVGRSVG